MVDYIFAIIMPRMVFLDQFGHVDHESDIRTSRRVVTLCEKYRCVSGLTMRIITSTIVLWARCCRAKYAVVTILPSGGNRFELAGIGACRMGVPRAVLHVMPSVLGI